MRDHLIRVMVDQPDATIFRCRDCSYVTLLTGAGGQQAVRAGATGASHARVTVRQPLRLYTPFNLG